MGLAVGIAYSVWVWLSALPIHLGFCFMAVLMSCIAGVREMSYSRWACRPGDLGLVRFSLPLTDRVA